MIKLTKPQAMTDEEKKALLWELVDGKQGQMRIEGEWRNRPAGQCAEAVIAGLEVRIKPEPRRMWVRWLQDGSVAAMNDISRETDQCIRGWHLITEPEGKE